MLTIRNLAASFGAKTVDFLCNNDKIDEFLKFDKEFLKKISALAVFGHKSHFSSNKNNFHFRLSYNSSVQSQE